MGQSYFSSAAERRAYEKRQEAMYLEHETREAARIADARRKLAAKIVMAVTDKIVNEVVRPGPTPEERECYEVAGELRALNPDLEALVKAIFDTENVIE